MKNLPIIMLLLSSSTYAFTNVDHARLSKKCPSGHLYKLTEMNRNNKTTTFQCVSNDGRAHPDYKFRIANWKYGDVLLDEQVGKIVTRFEYNKKGQVKKATQKIKGVAFETSCEFQYVGYKMIDTRNPKCTEMEDAYRDITVPNKQSMGFCEPINGDESKCSTADGRVYRPSTKESGISRFFYENGHVIDEQATEQLGPVNSKDR